MKNDKKHVLELNKAWQGNLNELKEKTDPEEKDAIINSIIDAIRTYDPGLENEDEKDIIAKAYGLISKLESKVQRTGELFGLDSSVFKVVNKLVRDTRYNVSMIKKYNDELKNPLLDINIRMANNKDRKNYINGIKYIIYNVLEESFKIQKYKSSVF